MSHPTPAAETLQREFLGIRSRLLDVAAALDRIGRSAGGAADDARLETIRRGLELLAQTDADRAEKLQHLFSLPYHDDWRQRWELDQTA